MDAKSLTDAGRHLVKASESGDPPSTLLTLLQPLQKFTATEDLLRQSKIGVAVNKLRQNKDPKVAQTAGQLINKWKMDVKRKDAAGKSSPKVEGNGVGVKKEKEGTPVVGGGRKSKVPPEKRDFKVDEVDTKVTGDPVRDGCVGLIYNGLAFMSETDPDTVLDKARSVEFAAIEYFRSQTSTEYKQKMRSLFQNLKMKGSGFLRKGVLEGKDGFTPKEFVRMTSADLKSAEKKAEDLELQKENMKQSQTPQEEKAISTTMTCNKCRQSRVAYTQAQTRSADEPMTTFCECTNCGNRWKFS